MPENGFQSIGELFSTPEFKALISRAFDVVPQGAAELEAAVSGDVANCERCRDSGYLRLDVSAGHADLGRMVECPCGVVAARRRMRIWASSQVPETMRGYSLESFAAHPSNAGRAQLVADLRAVWDDSNRWLLFLGPVGVGKTGLAISLLNAAMRRGSPGLYVVTPTYLSRIRATYSRNRDGEVDEMDVLASVIETPVLVLDDVGKVALSEWGQEKLFTLVNERYIAGRRTIVTTNLDTEDGSLEGHLWPATWDRIRGMSEVFRLTGESLR